MTNTTSRQRVQTARSSMAAKGGKAIVLGVSLLMPVMAGFGARAAAAYLPRRRSVSIDAGLTWVLSHSTRLKALTISPGANVSRTLGCCVTMTVDGVETGLGPGTYRGNLELTVTSPNDVIFDGITVPFRQALYLDRAGVVPSKSVLLAAGPFKVNDHVVTGLDIRSRGDNFNGVYVRGGRYTLRNSRIRLIGNGDNDFAGVGAAVMSSGIGTTLVVDGAHINTQGADRPAIVAADGSHLIVKNSVIKVRDGTLPADYVPNSAIGTMMAVPWMLGLIGDNRATDVVGANTMATYVNSDVAAERWGVLSTDLGQYDRLTAIDSRVRITGSSGYGTYAIGDSTNAFYGDDIEVPDYGAIVAGGRLILGATSPGTLERLNKQLDLRLSPKELASLPSRPTTIHSGRFGIMVWGHASISIRDATLIQSKLSTFLIKSAAADIRVNGAGGARLEPGNGVILQLMDSDNPGPVVVGDRRLLTAIYHEHDAPDVRAAWFDTTSTAPPAVTATFTDIALNGNFFNSSRSDSVGFPGGATPPLGRNLVIVLRNSRLKGAISATRARHSKTSISSLDYRLLGEVTNKPQAAINNGVIVTLRNSQWVVTRTCYLTRLSIGRRSVLTAARGLRLAMIVNGVATPITSGSFTGQIVLAVKTI